MSSMEFFHGFFEESDLPIEPEDDDDFYVLERQLECHFVKAKGKLYKLWASDLDVDPEHGFNSVLSPTERPQLFLYWYNGGEGLHEVAQVAIEKWLEE